MPAALAYIDPGIISIAIQAVFTAVFGVVTFLLLGPRRWITSIWRRLFSRRRSKPKASDAAPGGTGGRRDAASPGLEEAP